MCLDVGLPQILFEHFKVDELRKKLHMLRDIVEEVARVHVLVERLLERIQLLTKGLVVGDALLFGRDQRVQVRLASDRMRLTPLAMEQ